MLRGRREYECCHKRQIISTLLSQLDDLVTFGILGTSLDIERRSTSTYTYYSQYQSQHPAHFFHTNIHLPLLSLLVSLSRKQSLTPLEFIISLPGCVLKYSHSRCPLVPDTLDSLPWESQTHSHAWALLHLSPVPLGHLPLQPRLQLWLWPEGPGSKGCQRLERWRPRCLWGPSIPGFPRCDQSSGH